MQETLRYIIIRLPFGKVLLAASGKGICAISIGHEEKPLLEALAMRFPAAELLADRGLATLARQLKTHIENPRHKETFPLDLRGTAFQKKVWNALRNIPAGKTATYQEIAHRIGQPTAARAVAGACAANDIAILIPCHRIVRSDGNLSGYYWGVEFKKALLAGERTGEDALKTKLRN